MIRVYASLRGVAEGERELWSQLVSAAASVVSNLEEADEATSAADFVAKMKITLREARETGARMRLLVACGLAGHQDLAPLQDEAKQLSSIFATIVINTKRRIAEGKAKRETAANR